MTSLDDALVDLIDYCMRKMSFLSEYKHPVEDLKADLNTSEEVV